MKKIVPCLLVLMCAGAVAWYFWEDASLEPGTQPALSDLETPAPAADGAGGKPMIPAAETPVSVPPDRRPVLGPSSLPVPIVGGEPTGPTAIGPPPDDVPLRMRDVSTGDLPDPFDAQVYAAVQQFMTEGGPVPLETARQLLAATNSVLRMTGYALLHQSGRLTRDELSSAAQDADLAVPLMLTEWLLDRGSDDPAAYVMQLLEDRGLDAETMLDLVAQGNLQAGGGRVALDFLAAQLPAGEIGPVLLGLAGDAAQPYPLRMKAAIMAQQFVAPAEYLGALAQWQTATDDVLLKEGFKRQEERVRVPAPLAARSGLVMKQDIDGLVSRAYPMMLEDMATFLEDRLVGAAQIQPGTAERLLAYLDQRYKNPLAPAEQAAMVRLETLLPRLQAGEASADASVFEIHEGPMHH